MNFEKVFAFLLEHFKKHEIRYALMGGFALNAAGYARATQDIDLLILKEDIPKVKAFLLSLGYELAHESEDVSNFKGMMNELGEIDILHAHRGYTQNMLKRARECEILKSKFKVKVLIPEDIIGLKIQASSNDSSRYNQDLADIEKLLTLHKGQLDRNLLKEYFALFQREKELNELMERIENA